MPELTIKPTTPWSELNTTSARDEFVNFLIRELCEDVVTAWQQIGWGELKVAAVLPDILPPFSVYVPDTTPDLEIRIRPNFTPEKFAQQFEFLDIFEVLVTVRIEKLCARFGIELPERDVHLDFVYGCGTNVSPDGKRTSTWPVVTTNAP